MHNILAIFYKHNDFIEGNEKFKLGGEDLEKLKFSKNFKIFKLIAILNSYFFRFLPFLTP